MPPVGAQVTMMGFGMAWATRSPLRPINSDWVHARKHKQSLPRLLLRLCPQEDVAARVVVIRDQVVRERVERDVLAVTADGHTTAEGTGEVSRPLWSSRHQPHRSAELVAKAIGGVVLVVTNEVRRF